MDEKEQELILKRLMEQMAQDITLALDSVIKQYKLESLIGALKYYLVFFSEDQVNHSKVNICFGNTDLSIVIPQMKKALQRLENNDAYFTSVPTIH